MMDSDYEKNGLGHHYQLRDHMALEAVETTRDDLTRASEVK